MSSASKLYFNMPQHLVVQAEWGPQPQLENLPFAELSDGEQPFRRLKVLVLEAWRYSVGTSL